MQRALEAVEQLFAGHQRFVLTTHINPDGDGLGSEVALAEWLVSNGKQVAILNHSPTPATYLFLDPQARIVRYGEHHRDVVLNAEVIVVLDTNHPGRLQSMESAVLQSNATKVCIDHHPDPAPFAAHYLIDEDATATGEIVYKTLLHLNGPTLPPLTAQALYCAIMTDTGSFRYSHVDPEIHRITAHLIECGADPGEIYRRVYEQWTPGRIQLLAETLASLRVEHDGRMAHVTVSQDMLRRSNTLESDTDNFTVYPMSVSGVRAGILFLELPGGVKMSLRSRGDIPINALAREFGGNGHLNAAGARAENVGMDVYKQNVIRAAEKYLFTEQERKQ
jgi:phosphoesterase RecJ-like protein